MTNPLRRPTAPAPLRGEPRGDGGRVSTTVRAPHAENREAGDADHAGTFFPDSPSRSFVCRRDEPSQAACGASSPERGAKGNDSFGFVCRR